MGETKSPHFYDFGISGRVTGSQSQIFLSLETPGHLKQIQKKTLGHSQTIVIFIIIISIIKINMLENQDFVNIGKDGRRTIHTIRLIKSRKSWT